MTGSAVVFGYYPDLAGTIEMPASRGVFTSAGLVFFQRQSLPTDPVGTVTLTFPNVKAGSEIHVFLPDATEAAGVESASPGEQIVLQKYAAGSPNNTVRVLIVSLSYEHLDFELVLNEDASIPTFQRIDRNYRNPA